MYLVTVTPRNKNGSMSFTIPKEIVVQQNLKKGDQFSVITNGKKIVFEPANK